MSENEKVSDLENDVAWIIAGHLDRNETADCPPTDSDRDLAAAILDRIHGRHGYFTLARIAGLTLAAIIAVVILTLIF